MSEILRQRPQTVATRRSWKFRLSLAVGCPFIGMRIVVSIPGNGREPLVLLSGFYLCAAPLIAQVVEHVNQARLRPCASPLHDVEVGVGVQYAGLAPRRGDGAPLSARQCRWSARTRQRAVVIIPPENARITVAGEDEGVGRQLVVNHLVAAHEWEAAQPQRRIAASRFLKRRDNDSQCVKPCRCRPAKRGCLRITLRLIPANEQPGRIHRASKLSVVMGNKQAR